jgi:LPXTG-motif cell wall-anchored protein
MSETRETPEELRREIERTRRELGDTSNPAPLAAGIGGLLALLLLLRLLRRR